MGKVRAFVEWSRFLVSVFLLLGAITHLMLPWHYQLRLPFWVPYSLTVVWIVSGVQFSAAIGMLAPRTARAACGAMLAVLVLKLFPNIESAQSATAELPGVSGVPGLSDLAAVRLGIQAALILWCVVFLLAYRRKNPSQVVTANHRLQAAQGGSR